jgi:ATP-binding cassette, subfamily C (CFTR/MRP), member 1
VPKSGGKFQTGKSGASDRKAKQQEKKANKKKRDSVLPTTATTDSEKKADAPEKPFELKGLNLKIPKGSFVAIVGRVGSGKVSC